MIEKLIETVKLAGAEIMRIYASPFSVMSKEDSSPLTEADLASQDIILRELSKYSKDPVVSEEKLVSYAVRKSWKRFWLLDPIDGTREFVAKTGDFTISLGLIVDGAPVVGILFAPARDEIYYAEKGKGSFVVRGGDMKKLPHTKLAQARVALSRFHSSDRVNTFMKQNAISESQTLGSALKFGLLAEGMVNIYPRFSPSKEWDIAAGQIIVEEAGGKVIDLQTMKAPVYNQEAQNYTKILAVSNPATLGTLKL